MVRLLSRGDVGDLINMRETIDAVEEGVRQFPDATIPERIQIKKADPHGELFVMPGLLNPPDGEQTLGMKTVTIFPGNDEQGVPVRSAKSNCSTPRRASWTSSWTART